jgi:D-tyrosyl-tRNA(Tyr) deacylase
VAVEGERVSEIGPGLVILVGVGKGDDEAQADWLAEKVANLRIFEDEAGKMNRSVLEAGGSALVVSQFTLYANTEKGRRPSFIEAALPEEAEPLVAHFAKRLQFHGVPVQTGVFRAFMRVEIHNDGPVTIILER